LILGNVDEVVADFDGSVDFPGGDEGDRHVHAAALACCADVLLTDDHRGFGDPDALPYEIWTADELFCKIDDDAPHFVLDVTREQSFYWWQKRMEGLQVRSLDLALERAACPNFAERIREHLRTLAGI